MDHIWPEGRLSFLDSTCWPWWSEDACLRTSSDAVCVFGWSMSLMSLCALDLITLTIADGQDSSIWIMLSPLFKCGWAWQFYCTSDLLKKMWTWQPVNSVERDEWFTTVDLKGTKPFFVFHSRAKLISSRSCHLVLPSHHGCLQGWWGRDFTCTAIGFWGKWAENALSQEWPEGLLYTFPNIRVDLLSQVGVRFEALNQKFCSFGLDPFLVHPSGIRQGCPENPKECPGSLHLG